MGNVISAHSDEILVVKTNEGVKKYEIGSNIEFEISSGFRVEGSIERIGAESITINNSGAFVDYKLKNIINLIR